MHLAAIMCRDHTGGDGCLQEATGRQLANLQRKKRKRWPERLISVCSSRRQGGPKEANPAPSEKRGGPKKFPNRTHARNAWAPVTPPSRRTRAADAGWHRLRTWSGQATTNDLVRRLVSFSASSAAITRGRELHYFRGSLGRVKLISGQLASDLFLSRGSPT